MSNTGASLSARLLAWHAVHGRHDLPWTRERTPYRVWLSEIMLQQTQVVTVIPYFERFTHVYPNVHALSTAELDAVLHLWTGLGYYSRARNLHATARHLVEYHDGEFPHTLDALVALPGIGRSTAAAILAQAFELPYAILDGNVKRVLARYHAIDGYPGESAVLADLWRLSESHLPQSQVCDYTQALMDLGATLCTRSRPRCNACPLAADCLALATARQHELPARRPRRETPTKATIFLVIENDEGAVLLQRRPAHGVWGGLWGFPEIDTDSEATPVMAGLGLPAFSQAGELASFTHMFTHFKLNIRTLHLRVSQCAGEVAENDQRCWYDATGTSRIGLSAPVVRLLRELSERR